MNSKMEKKISLVESFNGLRFGIGNSGAFHTCVYHLNDSDIHRYGISWNFYTKRVGCEGKLFVIYKFRTYHSRTSQKSNFGKWMRKTKLDELPQLFNILKGEMSFVGPRPDIVGYYDVLEGDERLVLGLKPGLTSEAGIKYRNEEKLLENQSEPLKFNDEVLFPDKVKINLEYYHNLSFKTDLRILLKTFSILKGSYL